MTGRESPKGGRDQSTPIQKFHSDPLMYTIYMHNNYNKQYEEKCYNVIIKVIKIKHSE